MKAMLTAQEWDAFAAASPHASFLQSWAWGVMQERLHVPFWRLVITHEGQPVGAMLVLKRTMPLGQSWLYVPRGPLFVDALPGEAAWQQAHDQLLELAQRHHAHFVRLEPGWPPSAQRFLTQHDWRKADRDVQPRHTLALDLTQSTEALLSAMHQKTRYNIRLAEKKGVTIRFSTDATDLQHFLALTTDVQDRAAFRYHPPAYYHAMHAAHAQAGRLELGIAEKEGQVLAVHILITFGQTTTYVHGASSSRDRQLMAPHLLQWASIQRAKVAGSHVYDFFGVAPSDAAPDHPWSGITRFKEGFGGYRIEYVGAYDYVFDPAWYTTIQLARRVRGFFR